MAIAEILVMDDENRNLMLTLPESVTEGAGMHYSAGRVSLSGPFSSDLIVALSSDDTSEIAAPSSVTISAGATSATFNIMVLDDDEIDGTQTVTVTASAEGWVSGSATILVHDNDPGSLRLSSSTYSVDETGGSALITVNRVTSTSDQISVDSATSDGTATAGSDYIETSGTLVFAHGESQKTFSIPILDDLEPEGDETVQITLSNPGGGASLSSPTTAVLTIVDDDYHTIPYSQDFSGGLTAHGWTYYTTYYGRNQVVNGRLRMDGTSSSYYGSNEAVLTINLDGRANVLLSFFQAEFNDEPHTLPAAFSGRHNGDGVSISRDGNTWYTIVNASELAVGSLGRTYSVNLDEHAARIRLNYKPSFAYTRAFKIKFQRYGVGSYSNAGREWDDIVLDRASEPPYIPSDPVPGHEAQGIPILADQGHAVVLTWTGGDPDPDDAVTYDLLLGTWPDSLMSVAVNLLTPTFTKQSLAQGTTYYWQVVAGDSHGNITTAPVWQFTTWQPDLVVSSLTFAPEAGIVAGTEVTVSATVKNNGPAPVLSSFQVDLRVNGESLGAGVRKRSIGERGHCCREQGLDGPCRRLHHRSGRRQHGRDRRVQRREQHRLPCAHRHPGHHPARACEH